jgi:hypothetical protein
MTYVQHLKISTPGRISCRVVYNLYEGKSINKVNLSITSTQPF